jgi:replication-associated recombination protein RarA
MASKPRERALKSTTPLSVQSPMNWRPRTAEDLIGQARRVALAQAGKAKRLASDPSATMKLLLYGPPGVGKTSVVELVALQLAGTPLSIEDYNGREVSVLMLIFGLPAAVVFTLLHGTAGV